MRYDVSVIGLYILDVLGRARRPSPSAAMSSSSTEIRLTVAGTAGGTVIDTAKLGLRSLAVGAVGDDEKADFVLAAMQKFGIDMSAMQRLKGVPTSATNLNVGRTGTGPRSMYAAPPITSTFRRRFTTRCSTRPSSILAARACCVSWTASRAAFSSRSQSARSHRRPSI